MSATARSLHDMLREGPLPLDRAAVVGAQLAAILRDREGEGQPPHRQIDARKILIAWEGGQPIVQLLDPDGQADLHYLAPEQFAGGVVDGRADVYAVGALLFHMMQGVAPPKSQGRTAPPPLGGVPEPIRSIAQHCLQPDPDRRYATGHDLFQALATARQRLVGQ